jgi:YHYH protein
MCFGWHGAYACAVIGVALWAAGINNLANAHPGHDEPQADAPQSRSKPSLKSDVRITTENAHRTITSNGIPNHPTGVFPNRNNPNSVGAQAYRFRIPLEPKTNEKLTPIRGSLFGVALNGVVFDPGTAEFWNNDRRAGWNYEALGGAMNLGIDANHAHVQPNGAYHYHGIPTGLLDQRATEQGVAGGVTLQEAKRMLLLGYAADGFPIYASHAHADPNDAASPLKRMKPSYRLKSGTRPGGDAGPGGKYDGAFTADFEYTPGAGDLDECNGRSGVTPDYPKGTYYYVLTDEFPFIPRFFRGNPDASFRKNEGPGGPGSRRPPPPSDGQRGNRPPPPR